MGMPTQSPTGARMVWRNAPTRSVNVGGTSFAYRQLGPETGAPVIFLNHLAAELDRWDPRHRREAPRHRLRQPGDRRVGRQDARVNRGDGPGRCGLHKGARS